MSRIEWTQATWNPVTGCDRTSPGCDHCYALTMAGRLKLMGQPKYQNDGDPRTSGPGFAVTRHPDTLDEPLRWRKPRRVFVNSMSDLFHADVDSKFIARVWRTMERCPQHTFQILTKRADRMAAWVSANNEVTAPTLRNVWLGVSIENDRYSFRARHLRNTSAAVRFLSLEPLLGPLPSLNLDGIDWVIVGGESGAGARPMHPDWVRDIRDRCVDAGIPFFFKQWGEWGPYEPDAQPPIWNGQNGDVIDGHHLPADLSQGDPIDGWWAPDPDYDAIFRRVGKKAAGRVLDGRTWDEYPAAKGV